MGVGIRHGSTILRLDDVDSEVARFWDSAYDLKELYALKFYGKRLYATYIKQPKFINKRQEIDYIKIAQTTNWFDVLTHYVEKAQGKILDWKTALKFLLQGYMQSNYVIQNNLGIGQLIECSFVKPYVDLVMHFTSLGWEPFYYEETKEGIKVYL